MKAAQLRRSLTSLESWTERLLSGLSAGFGDADDFIITSDFRDYWNFYNEMVPFVREFATHSDNPEIKKQAAIFCNDNIENIEESIETYSSIFALFSVWDHGAYRRSTRDLELAMRNTFDNIRNLNYQLALEDKG